MLAPDTDPRVDLRAAIEDGADYAVAQSSDGDLEVGAPAVPDIEVAAWNLRRIAQLRERINERATQLEREIAFLRDRHEQHAERMNREIRWRATGLELYMRRTNQEDPHAKTVETIYGTLRLRKARPTREFPKDAELARWLLENGHPEMIKREVDRGLLARRTKIEGDVVIFKDTGETIEPIKVKPAGDPKFSYSLLGFGHAEEEEGEE